jgi:hypothetical protein
VEQDVIECLAATLRRGDEDAQILARRLLPDEFVEALWAQGGVRIFRGPLGRRDAGGVRRHQTLVKVTNVTR